MKWFNDAKGFGFITPDGNTGKDAFVHYSEIQGSGGFRSLAEGDRVEFWIDTTAAKGPAAKEVVKLS